MGNAVSTISGAAALLLILTACTSVDRTSDPVVADPTRDEVAVDPTGDLSVSRTTDQIVVEAKGQFNDEGRSYGYRFFRNAAYQCGRTGDFTFLVIEPADNPGAEAPLWVYLHGGGVGYYDDESRYHGGPEEYNDEESLRQLRDLVVHKIRRGNGTSKDTTLRRRMDDGYRILVPSMCDHDLHAGKGDAYPNNPNGLGDDGGEVNGLQANMAAVDHTVSDSPTTDVFVHGTSAGSVGAWALTWAYHSEGIDLTGAILDSYFLGPRTFELFDADVMPQQKDPEFDMHGVIDKVGYFTEHDYVEDAIARGFRAVPLFALTGSADNICAGNAPAVPAAKDMGIDNNCTYWQGGIAAAVATQANSPHKTFVLEGGGHTPTNDGIAEVNEQIEPWLDGIVAGEPAPPFGE